MTRDDVSVFWFIFYYVSAMFIKRDTVINNKTTFMVMAFLSPVYAVLGESEMNGFIWYNKQTAHRVYGAVTWISDRASERTFLPSADRFQKKTKHKFSIFYLETKSVRLQFEIFNHGNTCYWLCTKGISHFMVSKLLILLIKCEYRAL